jgi:hypothetical protein
MTGTTDWGSRAVLVLSRGGEERIRRVPREKGERKEQIRIELDRGEEFTQNKRSHC